MSDVIKKIKTKDGDKQIDYDALANLPVSDVTLTQEGSFADAKIVGEKINKLLSENLERKNEISVERARINALNALEEGSTTGDAELMDGRTDYKGNTHVNIGEHIRAVSSQLSKEKVSMPKDSEGAPQTGVAGQVLESAGDGTTRWVDKTDVDIALTDDGAGNVTVQTTTGKSVVFTDDGDGNVTMEV